MEFYDRDRAHEDIHQQRCNAPTRTAARESLDGHIEEEIEAYKHSVQLSKAYVKLLAFQCSTRSTPAGLRQRAQQVEQLLAAYRARSGG